MKTNKKNNIPKTPTGIHGLDEITEGGLPKGRPTLIGGSAGCGETLFAVQFLVKALQSSMNPAFS
ncbi:MAG: ATPase domain-containing protein [Puia sp.]